MRRRWMASAILAVWMAMCAKDVVWAQGAWRYIQPQSDFLLGLEWRRVASSKLGQQLRASLNQMPSGEISGLGRLNLFDATERVLIAGRMPAGTSLAGPNSGLAVLEGTFDWPSLRAAMLAQGARPVMHAGRQVLLAKRSGAAEEVVALAEPQVLVIGERKMVEAALSGAPPPAASPLYQRARSLAGRNDIWLAGSIPPNALPGDASPQARMLAGVVGFDLGVNLRDGVRLEANFATKSASSASELAGGIRLMMNMAAMQQTNQPELTALAGKVRIEASGVDVRMSLQLDQAELERSFRSLHAMLPGGMKPVQVRPVYRGEKEITWPAVEIGGPAASPAAEAQAPPERQVIRIYGAEGGTREIPLNNK